MFATSYGRERNVEVQLRYGRKGLGGRKCVGGDRNFFSSFLSLILCLSLSSVSVFVCVWISLMDIRKFRYFIQPVYTTSDQFSTLRIQSL